MKKIVIIIIAFVIAMMLVPSLTAESPLETGPRLETSILTGFNMFIFQIFVENTGDEIAHNVTLTDVTVEGKVLFNFQEANLWSENIAPGSKTILDPNSLAIGFGKFSLSMTVACDEAVNSTSTVDGLIVGPVIFIP